jgi:glucose/arabinose dehydrogenase
MPNVSGDKPCTELETRAGIWRYDANKTDQKFSTTERYATGIRNADGIAMDSTGLGLYAAQQGRDELYENWPKLYNEDQGANLPAEELLQVAQGDDFGWPECYFDNDQQK